MSIQFDLTWINQVQQVIKQQRILLSLIYKIYTVVAINVPLTKSWIYSIEFEDVSDCRKRVAEWLLGTFP